MLDTKLAGRRQSEILDDSCTQSMIERGRVRNRIPKRAFGTIEALPIDCLRAPAHDPFFGPRGQWREAVEIHSESVQPGARDVDQSSAERPRRFGA